MHFFSSGNPKEIAVRTVEFRNHLNEDNALRVRFTLAHGNISHFAVQLECLFDGKWEPVIRYDTSHGFAHCDRLHPWEKDLKTRMLTQNYNDALTFAINDLTIHWQKYRKRYQRWKNCL